MKEGELKMDYELNELKDFMRSPSCSELNEAVEDLDDILKWDYNDDDLEFDEF